MSRIILVDWYILKNEAAILSYFSNLLKNKLTDRQKLLYNKQVNLVNFVQNLPELLNDKASTNIEKEIYLDLAFKRDYFKFSTTGEVTLPIEIAICSGYSLSKLKYNPILSITDSIHFKYEK